jgi:hypothetical protein
MDFFIWMVELTGLFSKAWQAEDSETTAVVADGPMIPPFG